MDPRSAPRLVTAVVLAGLSTLIAPVAWGGDPPAPPATLDLSIRARALGLVPEPLGGGQLGLETVKAPTGAGSTRMPRAASGREPGLYVGVVVCEPDGTERLYQVRVDDDGTLPEGNLRGTPGPRALYIPGRPIP